MHFGRAVFILMTTSLLACSGTVGGGSGGGGNDDDGGAGGGIATGGGSGGGSATGGGMGGGMTTGGGTGGGGADVDAGTGGGATSSWACSDGVMNGTETGVDCGGSCGGDCCANGYADVNLTETGVDCGGACGACTHATYFVSNGGDDTHDGRSPATAWKTIDRVNQATLQPGDAVLFHRGDEWREELQIASSGTATAPITFGPYGQGPRPRILGSTRATGWTQVSGSPNVWRSATSLAQPIAGGNANRSSSIFFGETNGATTWGRVQQTNHTPTCGTNFASLTQEYDWCWQSNAVYVYSPQDPSTRYAFVEVPQRAQAISNVMRVNGPQEHLVIDGLELLYTILYGYTDGWPMDFEVRGLEIRNCHVGYVGIQGGDNAMGLQIWHSDMVVRNNEIHDCGRRSISYNVYLDNGRDGDHDGVCDATSMNLVFENVLFDRNVLYHGFHTTGFDVSSQAGTVPTCNDTFRNFTFSNNLIWDDPADDAQEAPQDFTSMGIYLYGTAGHFEHFTVFNNVLEHIKQKALVLEATHDAQVFNNTFYGMNPRAIVPGQYRALINVSGDTSGLSIFNNALYGNELDPDGDGLVSQGTDTTPDTFYLRLVQFAGTSQSGVVELDRNLYFQEIAGQGLVSVPSNTWDASEWSAYQSSGPGWDQHSPAPADPRFVAPATLDFHPQAGSPLVDAARAVTGRTTDFLGHPLSGPPDIGAVELAAP